VGNDDQRLAPRILAATFFAASGIVRAGARIRQDEEKLAAALRIFRGW
jgi:hypothetical protein